MKIPASVLLPCSLGLALLCVNPLSAQNPSPAPDANAPYRNPKLTVDERVADLLPRLTLEEKVEQISGGIDGLHGVIDPTGTYDLDKARAILLQSDSVDFAISPRDSAILRNAIQRYQLEKTRLGIPALFQGEALHGFMESGSTSFPQALGLAATWDPALVHQIFTAAGNEAGARGIDQVFSPVLDLARDPRWGRTEETYGEDPFLVSRMGVAVVTGLQGPNYAIGRDHVIATGKHFAVHGQPEGGTNTAPGNYSERVIRENFLVPFKAVVQEANVGSIMASYNEIDGIPSHINHWLLDRVLRQEWGFQGFITSDGDGIQMLWQTHHVAADNADAARQSIAAGIDYDLSDGAPFHTLLWQVKQGIVPESDVDRAVSKILSAKFRLGLFDNPYVDPDAAATIVNSADHRALAEKAAEEVLVLLKNDKNLLPLDLSKLHSIAVIGPNVADTHLGGYSRQPGHEVSILQGIKDYVGTKAKVNYAEGCKITLAPEGWRGWYANDVQLAPADQSASIAEAVAAARKSDVALIVIGENESTNREAWAENHLGDRDSLDLLGAQNDLVKAVLATGKPVIVLLINGRPLSINSIAENVPAILEGFYLGEEGGTAAARVLFGDVAPGGKLPITFPHSVGNLPDFYNHKPSDNRTYAFSTRQPLYPFGYGLSYTTFKFENLRAEPEHIETGGTAKISVDVTNTGSRAGDEVPQLYVHQRIASVTRPVKQLRGFQRITLQPGEKRTVTFTVGPDDLSLLGVDMQPVVEPGVFEIMVGPSSADTKTIRLDVGSPGAAPKPPLPPPPAGSESGIVSTFDEGKPTANYGVWMPASDSMNGGKSQSAIAIVSPGADSSKGALQVSGEVVSGSQYPFGGAMFMAGAQPMKPANLSGKKEIRFWAKGDGHSYTLLVLTEQRNGQNGIPAMVSFAAGPEWKLYTFPFSTFETDGSDITALAFADVQNPGKFTFEIDQVEIR